MIVFHKLFDFLKILIFRLKCQELKPWYVVVNSSIFLQKNEVLKVSKFRKKIYNSLTFWIFIMSQIARFCFFLKMTDFLKIITFSLMRRWEIRVHLVERTFVPNQHWCLCVQGGCRPPSTLPPAPNFFVGTGAPKNDFFFKLFLKKP